MRPRATLGAALTLGVFLISGGAPVVLLPLALLLLTSRPTRTAAWVWLVLGSAWTAAWCAAPGPLAEQVVKGWTVVASGAFLFLALDGRRRVVDAAVLAALVACAATLAWMRLFHIDFGEVVIDVLRALWASWRIIGDQAPSLRPTFADASASAESFAVVFPGIVVLCGMSGLLVAWRWYHILSDRPAGAPPAPVTEFRFSDHLIWGFVLGLGGTVAQIAGALPDATIWPANFLVVFGGLYIARGHAVVRTLMLRWGAGSGLPLLLGVAVAVLFLPFVLTAFLGIGLADTWLDLRRPPRVAPGE